jgi:hypothetical protein
MKMMNKVFIQSNKKQYLGALVAKYTIERYSNHNEKFFVEIIQAEKVDDLNRLYNQEIIKDNSKVIYGDDDLQSFTLTRFMAPELMSYEGRSIVIDPDIFATYSDIWELFSMDMGNNSALMRRHSNKIDWGTSVMLLENSKFKHWKIKSIVDDLLSKKIDYRDWMGLRNEKEKIGILPTEWNSYDELTVNTKLLHNTLRVTQPWKVGLDVEYTPKKMKPLFGFISREWVHSLLGRNPLVHREHPDQNQIDYFFGHLKKAVEDGVIDINLVLSEINLKHIRQDAIVILEKTRAI